MAQPLRPQDVIRFGIFEADLRAGELRKKGMKVKLQEQPFQILAVLLERPGEVVTREELQQRLWSDDTFVDFDHSLNIAINRIRQALDDSAENPRFVETLPRRGYRFIAPVEGRNQVFPPANPPGIDVPVTGLATSSLNALRHRLSWRVLVSVCSITLIAILVILWMKHSPPPSTRIIPLTTFPGYKESPVFSPDGNQLAFVWDGGDKDNLDIYVKLIDAEKPLRLTSSPGDDSNPSWSPDGRQIAFLRSSPTERGIYVIPSLGGPERRMADSIEPFDWSPDGKLLAVAERSSPQDTHSIFVISLNTGERRRVTFPTLSHDVRPKFSPDGKNLAFTRGSAHSVTADIYLVPVVGGEPRRLTFDNGWIFGLCWTSDSREVVFSSNRKGLFSLWKIPASGGTPEALPAVGEDAYFPSISRQGNHLAYVRWRMDFNIWQTDGPNSTQRHNLPIKLISSTREDVFPDISPDGKRVVFGSDRSGSTEIWVSDRNGQSPFPLTSFGGPQTGWPHWSPDGRRIVFHCCQEGHTSIFMVNAEGGELRQLTTDTSNEAWPSWSKDGRWVYFASTRTETWEVWKRPAEGGQPVRVTKHGGGQPLESSDGKSLFYFKDSDGPRAIWRVSLDGGEENCVLQGGRVGPLVCVA